MVHALRPGGLALLVLGALTSGVGAEPQLTVSFKTTPVGAIYAPENIVAVWIEGPGPTFVKTIGRWAGVRQDHLVAWTNMAGPADVDAISGATRLDHGATLEAIWDGTDALGAVVPEGLYTLRLETADGNSTASGQNNQGTFTFTKGPAPEVQSALTSGGHVEVTITFDPNANQCDNAVVDTGETCDPPGTCPSTCDQRAATACAPNVLVGSAATCDAACVIQTITACVDGDGCCAEGCTGEDDRDCVDGPVEGGCATGGAQGPGAALALLLLGLCARRRR